MQTTEKHTVELPLSVFGNLKVKKGDKLEGVVNADNKAMLSVITIAEVGKEQQKKINDPETLINKWRGKFKNPKLDITKDARLEYIMNR